MEFSVNSTALTGLVEMLDRRWQDYESGRSYLKGNAHFSVFNVGVLNAIHGTHQRIVDEIDAFLAAAAEGFAGPCSTAVVEANSLYVHSDRAAAARTDAAMPAPSVDQQCPTAPFGASGSTAGARADSTLGPQVFADPVCPSARYRQPPDHRADHPYRFSFFDTFSPTSWGREAIWKVTGLAAKFGVLDRPYDVLAEAVEPLCGDWAGFLTCADVYDNIAGAIDDTVRCVTTGGHTIDRVWTGNAAETCAQSLGRFTVELNAAIGPLHQTATTYRQVAEGVYLQAEAVASILTLVLDNMIEKALEPVTGGAIEPFEVVTEVSDLVRVAEKIREVVRLVSKAREMATATMDSADSGLSGFGLLTNRHPVPALVPSVPTLPFRSSARAE
ncbi:hypothetical protein [Rugosimonospora africana]|uniref:Uncharacterized protein n=1 Tax=Rugosimonospora africana TaxID=556532 RepID=A0A8J3VTG8_9ACTN|nr:hypothetical protein [Rugosimonospora africana]GIH18175.1 hypothetical protein Raf01_63470 [Rugosimonospora africana]